MSTKASLAVDVNQSPRNIPEPYWESIGVSPTNLKTHDSTMKHLTEDGMLNQQFYTKGANRLRACVQYVYGRGLYSDLDPAERVNRIFKLVSTKDSLNRLCSIVFSHPQDNLIVHDGQADAYIHMALTAHLFCSVEARGLKKKDFKVGGGFPHKPVMFLQKGSNCYHPATVLFISLHHQHIYDHSRVLDAAQVARRFLFKDHERLEKRVCEDGGYNTCQFAEEVSQVPFNNAFWNRVKCVDVEEPDYIERLLCAGIDFQKVGLVSGFTVTKKFMEAAQTNPQFQKDKHLGYIFFDGEDPSKTNGQWVSFEQHYADADNNLKWGVPTKKSKNKYREAKRKNFYTALKAKERAKKTKKHLREMEAEIKKDLHNQNSKGKERLDSLKKKLKASLATGMEDPFSGCNNSSSSPTSQSSGKHAMVLLAYEQDKNEDGRAVFLLQNSWKEMPLVGVSARYLLGCEAEIRFLKTDAIIADDLDWNSETRIIDCVSFNVEGGDETDPEGWIHDAFGLTHARDETGPCMYDGSFKVE